MFDAYATVTVVENTIIGPTVALGLSGGTNVPYQFMADWYNYIFGAPLDFSHVAIPAAPTLGSRYYNSAGLQLSFNAGDGFTTASGSDYARSPTIRRSTASATSPITIRLRPPT
jgi:hypothetical protein